MFGFVNVEWKSSSSSSSFQILFNENIYEIKWRRGLGKTKLCCGSFWYYRGAIVLRGFVAQTNQRMTRHINYATSIYDTWVSMSFWNIFWRWFLRCRWFIWDDGPNHKLKGSSKWLPMCCLLAQFCQSGKEKYPSIMYRHRRNHPLSKPFFHGNIQCVCFQFFFFDKKFIFD